MKFGTIRVAITGRTTAPPLFDAMEVLGRDRVRHRLERALDLTYQGCKAVRRLPSMT
jgi:glutamyl/glutaminyl-tRNA synthetase